MFVDLIHRQWLKEHLWGLPGAMPALVFPVRNPPAQDLGFAAGAELTPHLGLAPLPWRWISQFVGTQNQGPLGQMDWLTSKCFCSPALQEALDDLVLEGFLDVGPLCCAQLLPEGDLLSFLDFTLQDICFLQTVHCLHVRRQALKTRGENKRYEWKET